MDKHNILIVDDERSVRSALRRILENELWNVLQADSPGTALALLAANPVSAIITDERMPGCSGLEFMRIVKKKYPHVARIMLTAHANTRTVIRAVNEGEIFRFFTKPWNNEELIAAIQQAVEAAEEQKLESTLLSTFAETDTEVEELERRHPGITEVKKDEGGRVIIEDNANS